ncbi:MAG TPA: hypothetical protein VJ922_01220 [Actinomycetota bacterium]|nr:hypothetical protein [Actinomycetota bacterium]
MEEPEVDLLYSLPLDEFTEARDALAARLRTAGDAAEAARIKAMRKPTAPAWAVNQLARRYTKQVEVLIAASDRLRRAQQDLLEGASATDLWEATLAEREAVGELMKAAEWILKESGLGTSRAALDRVSDTLYAAAADPTGRTLLRRGLITHEMRRAGFGDMIVPPVAAARAKSVSKPAGAKPATSKPSKPSRSTREAPKGRGATGARPGATPKQVLEAERALARAEKAADRAEEDADRLAREAERDGLEAVQARKRADAAAKAAIESRAEASAARKEAEEARRDAGRAEANLEKIRRSRG